MTTPAASPVTLDEQIADMEWRTEECGWSDANHAILTSLRELKRIKEARDVEPVARLLHRIKPPYEGARAIAARTYDECHENAYPDTWREGDKLYGPEVLDLLAAEKLKLAKVMEALREARSMLNTVSLCRTNNCLDCREHSILNLGKINALFSELGKTDQMDKEVL